MPSKIWRKQKISQFEVCTWKILEQTKYSVALRDATCKTLLSYACVLEAFLGRQSPRLKQTTRACHGQTMVLTLSCLSVQEHYEMSELNGLG